jgi:hypothetical protein
MSDASNQSSRRDGFPYRHTQAPLVRRFLLKRGYEPSPVIRWFYSDSPVALSLSIFLICSDAEFALK